MYFYSREQVKSDAKDLKVLNILQQKDQQINTLQEVYNYYMSCHVMCQHTIRIRIFIVI